MTRIFGLTALFVVLAAAVAQAPEETNWASSSFMPSELVHSEPPCGTWGATLDKGICTMRVTFASGLPDVSCMKLPDDPDTGQQVFECQWQQVNEEEHR